MFPVLLPGIENLLLLVKRRQTEGEDVWGSGERHESLKWLARYLVEVNPAHRTVQEEEESIEQETGEEPVEN